MFGKMISNMMIKPHQSPLFDDPAAYGLDHEDVSFKTRDGVTLRGWFINAGGTGDTGKVIVQSHFGVQCNRAGYCPDGKGLIKPWKQNISFLRQAKHLADKGYSVLMYDFRGHGESDGGPKPWITWGPEEAKDVIAAVDYVASREDCVDAEIGLLSICMGSAATTYAFGEQDGLSSRDRVKAMIAVQPLLYTYFLDAFGMPGFLRRAGDKISKERLGFDLGGPNFIDDVGQISVPTLVVQNKNDPWTNLEMVNSYFDGIKSEKEMMLLDIEKNRFAAYDYLGREPGDILAWFDKHM